jgi:hypothetical protein
MQAARENVRRQQQGHGRPIISTADRDFRLVAVGNTIYWSKHWLTFPDFLLHFVKQTFGREWGVRERPKGQHPLFRWLDKFRRHSASLPNDGKLKRGPLMGYFACWLHLAYALYLIQHNDKLPKPLLKRLRAVSSLMPAYYEAIVGAALTVAGFELSCAETKATSVPTPEFRAKSRKSGKTYEVEAKRKERWNAPTDDPTNPDFQRELESYVRGQIHRASKKKLTNPIYCFELSIPTVTTEAAWRTIAAQVDGVIRATEATMTVDGQPLPPALVLVTNHTFLVNEDMVGAPFFGSLATVNIHDYPMGELVDIEVAFAGYDKYRDLFWLADAWKFANVVPTTFDGSPPELLAPDGQLQRTIQVGDMFRVSDEHGNEIVARVRQIVSTGDKATAVVYDEATKKTWLASVPLTKAEKDAAAHFTDAVFGNSDARHRLREGDPFDLYDFFLDTYGNITREQADRLFEATPALRHLKDVPLEEARVRLAREFTKRVWARQNAQVTRETNTAQGGATTAGP